MGVVNTAALYLAWLDLYKVKNVKEDTPRRTQQKVASELMEMGLVCNWGDCWWLPAWADERAVVVP